MTKIKFSGPITLRIKSFATLNRIALATYFRHAIGSKMAPDWDANTEIGIRFIRHQFTAAMKGADIERGRLLFDSVQPETDDMYEVKQEACAAPQGHWYRPKNKTSKATLLYFHGGGYTFHGGVSKRHAEMLAHRTGAEVFAPDYRLTPEHTHPAQAQDALAAWTHITKLIPPKQIVVIGDSAGGHMALMLLQTLKANKLPQPALCIGLCPWTDIGDRGESLHSNDTYDLVQGWMALQFGQWLDPNNDYGRENLSPINQDFKDLAPLYLQTGGREVLHDMILEFAEIQKLNGATLSIDSWPDMPHNFHAYDNLKKSSREALAKIKMQIEAHVKP